MGIWLGPNGIEVEALVVNDRPCLRVTRLVGGRRTLVADCADVQEVSRYVDLSQLVLADTEERERFSHVTA
ncbi:hypothetical protein ACFOWE_11455 [Planomonospora corallina]|uniref:Uncharacterized protein n=1 Tax=Planomonospora corallina TaxID=1806052 RepID=A0ABV8I6W3_9ACTN